MGDTLLQAVASTIQGDLRSTDLVARVGGDEFVLMLPETGAESAAAILHRIRQALLDCMQRHSWPVTFSIGAVSFVRAPDSVEEMIRQVDGLMYTAKNKGKDRIEQAVWGE